MNFIKHKRGYINFLYLGLILIFLYQIYVFLHFNPQFYYYWDWPGHIDKALQLSWPWVGGWDTRFWGGYTTLTYPSFSHYLLRGFTLMIPNNLYRSLETFVICVFLFQLWSYVYATKKLISDSAAQIIAFCSLIILTAFAHGSFLASFTGLTFVGGFSASIATSMFLILISVNKYYLKGLLYGLIILTHPLTALVSSLYLIAGFTLSFFKSEKTSTVEYPINWLKSLMLGIFIGMPWIITFFDSSLSGQALNIIEGGFFAPLLIGTFFLILIVEKHYSLNPLIITSLALACLSLTIKKVALSFLPLIGIQGLHFYRFKWWLFLLLILITTPVIVKWLRFKNPLSLIIILMVSVLLLIWLPAQKSNYTIEFDSKILSQLEGRVVNITPMNVLPNYPHLIETYAVNNSTASGSIGLYYESSPLGLQYYEFANQIEPNVFKNGTYDNLFNLEGSPIREFDIRAEADLLGINYALDVEKESTISAKNTLIIGRAIAQYPENNLVLVAKKISLTPLIEPLSVIPEYLPKQQFGSWWLSSAPRPIYVRDQIKLPEISSKSGVIKDVQIKSNRIDFVIDSLDPIAVVVKFTHNKHWRLSAPEYHDSSSKPYWISPGQMLVIGYGPINLQWVVPLYIYLSWIISSLGFLLCMIAFFRHKKGAL